MKFRWIYIAGCLIAFPAVAQQQQPQSQSVEYNLKINAQELDLIGKSLGLMPFNDVAGLIQKLRSQVIEQQPKETEKK